MEHKNIYKKFSDKHLLNKFNDFNITRLWKQYLPKEIIRIEISSFEEGNKINYFDFEKHYCGHSILDGLYNTDIKKLLYIYNNEIILDGIYIDKNFWFIFFRLNDKKKYIKIKYDTFDFNKEKEELINYLVKKNYKELDKIKKLINYLKNSSKEIDLYPINENFPKIPKFFANILDNEEEIRKNISYNSLINGELFNIEINEENEDDLNVLTILWNDSIYEFKFKLNLFLKWLLNNNVKKITRIVKSNNIDFIVENNKFTYGILFFDIKTSNKKIIQIVSEKKNKLIIQKINDKVYFPYENRLFEDYSFNFQVLFNLLDKIKEYRKIIKSFSSNKNNDIKFIVVFNNSFFKISDETILKINEIIKKHNENFEKFKLDEFLFLSNLENN